MPAEFLNVLRARGPPYQHSTVGNHWAKRKAVHRAKRSAGKPYTEPTVHISLHTGATDLPASPVDGDTASPAPSPSAPSRISAGESEWIGATGGPPAEVVLRLHPPAGTNPRGNLSGLPDTGGSGVVVRAEEALIVVSVMLLWVAAIALFFNRWGKIRCVYKLMLEPYQPKFQQQHRTSCALADSTVSVPPHHRASLSRGCVSYDYGSGFPAYQPCGHLALRPRQNSVFVGSMGAMALIPESPPRRSRSAADLGALAPAEHPAPAPRASRAASLHSAGDLRAAPPSPRALDRYSAIQVHARGSGGNLSRPRSPRRLTVTNV